MTQHNDNEQVLESSFNDWLMGKDIPEQVLVQLQMHPVWSERMLAFSQLETMAEQASHEPINVPTWQKDQGFEQHLKQISWWQQQRLSLVALTFSVFACVIMLFDLRINLADGGMTIATADVLQKQKLEQQFANLAQQNNELIQTRLDNFQASQQQNTAQLVSYVLNNSRLERKEDIQ
ncbi:MAG: hypothetical protein HWE10_12220, partial [Gammaproteobacteria bacterium]|nr:hypothetical protein [Gammaproteobacteria bacterium]